MDRTGGFPRPLAPGREDVEHRLILPAARRGPDRGCEAAAEGEIHRLRGAAARCCARAAVPEGQQHMAVQCHIDPRLAKLIVSSVAAFRRGLCLRCHKDLLRPLTVEAKMLQGFGTEVFFVVLPGSGQRRDQPDAKLVSRLGTEQVSALGQGREHEQAGVGAELLQLQQLCLDGLSNGGPVPVPDGPMSGHANYNGNSVFRIDQPSISRRKE